MVYFYLETILKIQVHIWILQWIYNYYWIYLISSPNILTQVRIRDIISFEFTHSFSKILNTYAENLIWEGHFYYMGNKMSVIHQIREAVILCPWPTRLWAPWGAGGLTFITSPISTKASRHRSAINCCWMCEWLKHILTIKSGKRYTYLHTVRGIHWSPA